MHDKSKMSPQVLNVGRPIIELTEIESPKPKESVIILPDLSVYLVLYVTTAVNLLASLSSKDDGTAQSSVRG